MKKMKRKWILAAAAILIVLLLWAGYDLLAPRPILEESRMEALEGMEIYFSQEPEMAVPPPYETWARLTYIVSPDFDRASAGSEMKYSSVYVMDEAMETGLRELLGKTKMQRVIGKGEEVSSNQYTYHLECRLPGENRVHVFVGSKQVGHETIPCRVETNGHSYRIPEDDAFREAFEQFVWDYMVSTIRERAWEGEQIPIETKPDGWLKRFTKGRDTVTVKLLFYRSMEPGNLWVSYDGVNFDRIGDESIMYGVKGHSNVRSAEMNFFCEFDGEWLYISGLDLTAGSHDDCVYKVNLKFGRTVPTVLRAPAYKAGD